MLIFKISIFVQISFSMSEFCNHQEPCTKVVEKEEEEEEEEEGETRILWSRLVIVAEIAALPGRRIR